MNRFRCAPGGRICGDDDAGGDARRGVRAVGEDGRAGRRRRRPCPGAGPPAGCRNGRSTRRSTCSCPATARCPSRPTRDAEPVLGSTTRTSAGPGRRSTSRSSTWRRTATACASWTSPRRSIATRFYDHPDDPWRFAVFCRAAMAALRRDGRPLDVLHVHDWHTGPALIERARADLAGDPFLAPTAVVVTLHNLAYHGWTGNDDIGPARAAPGRAARRRQPARHRPPAHGDRAVRDREHGLARLRPRGADARVRHGPRRRPARQGRPVRRDPERHRPRRLGPVPTTPRSPCRTRGRPRRARRPAGATSSGATASTPTTTASVLGMIGRMDPQKGFDLLADGTPDLLAAGARVIVQGSGHASLADPFRALAAAHPAQVALIERFDRDMARRIYAGADLFLMPSRFEPCGQGQMIALRYGTPPVVRRTGGLADSVVDVGRAAGDGDGLRVRRRDAGRAGRGGASGRRIAGRRIRPRGRRSATGAWPWTSAGTRDPRRDTSRRTAGPSPCAGAARRIRLRPIHPAGSRARRGGQPGGPDAQAVRRPGHQPARPARDARRADGRARRRPAGDRRRRHRRRSVT